MENSRTTRWTLVLESKGDSPSAKRALSDLCETYYLPVVAFLRSEGRTEDAARELAHEFFARLLKGGAFDRADPHRGHFRSYLLGALKHFLTNLRAVETRAKRGGGLPHETTSGNEWIDRTSPSPDLEFDRQWALSLIDRVFEIMKSEAGQRGTAREFDLLKPWLVGEHTRSTQSDPARALGISEGVLRVRIHRLRRRFRALVMAEIADTVKEEVDILTELRHLLGVL